MAEITLQLDGQQVHMTVAHEGNDIAQQDIEMSPQIVTHILQAIERILAEHKLTRSDISASSVHGTLQGSSATRAVSVTSEMLDLAARRRNLTK